MSLTQQQVQDIQALTSYVEQASRALQRSKTALSYLIQAGRAACTDVRSYNLMVKSTYLYQKSIADIIKANGSTPPDIPAPVYVAYKGVSGEAATNIDCSGAQLKGWLMKGLGDFWVNPKDVEWRQGATPSDVVEIANTVSRSALIKNPDGQLGNPLLAAAIPIILWGIVITVAGIVILKIVEALTDVPAKREYTKQVAIAAERHAATMEARQKCLLDCAKKGDDDSTCARNCSRVFAEYKAPSAPFQMGLVGKVVVGAVLVGVVVLGVKFFSGRLGMQGSGQRSLPRDDDDELDGAEGDYIDAEYEEA